MVTYNSYWHKQFSWICGALRDELQSTGCEVTFEHIGITAVPDLPSQPVVDILIVRSSSEIDGLLQDSTKSGTYKRQDDARFPNSILLESSYSSLPHTITLCPTSSLAARAHLAIRDTLLTDADQRAEYTATLTTTAATSSPDDLIWHLYRGVKPSFLQHILIASSQFSVPELATLFALDLSSYWQLIATPRLELREYELRDAAGMFTLESNPDNARYQSWQPWTALEARQNVIRGVQRALFESDRTVIELAVLHEGAFVGRIGASIGNPVTTTSSASEGTLSPSRRVALWYSFIPSAQGKGLATEAMQAFIPRVLQRVGKEGAEHVELEIECDPRNTGSWKLAERLGFERAHLVHRAWECKGEWVDSLVYRKMGS